MNVARLFYRAYRQATHLTVLLIEDPQAFTKFFDAEGQPVASLQIRTPGLGYGGGRVIYSPLFPYKELETTTVIKETIQFRSINQEKADLSVRGRYYHFDPFWKVFWVEIGNPEDRQYTFYGPYGLKDISVTDNQIE